MKTLTKEETTELAALRLIAARHDAAWKKHASFSRGGASSATQEQQARIRADVGQDFTNEQRSRLEVLEFVANPPDRYFAYIREDDRGMSNVTTFIGDSLGVITQIGRPYKIHGFGGFPSERVNFQFRGINGFLYSGTYYKSSGNYCRVRRINVKTPSPFARWQTPERHLRTLHFRPYAGDGARFTLTTWDTDEQRDGKNRLCYQLTQRSQGKRVVLFQGDDFFCAPGHAVDSDQCVESIMSFLTLRPGDTDSDYFKDYNETQKEFCAQHAESLACEVKNRFCDENGNVKTR